ncbi:MAG: lysophospholipase [Zhongshania sp.]|uniref:alpha/beta hydrolase n=1 Tax=Zhongshania sp. TaxID=1971902 RepID=UPI002633B6B8|nr:alpha/beta hydrolase [Zhongshania sp.]MDF1690817.1 lysophospholipase [Zhongshania sp.]
MAAQAENFTNATGTRIHTRSWQTPAPKAQIVILHGLGEHGERYQALATTLNDSGYSCYALDHVGHGLSDGEKGHIDDFAIFVDTAAEFIAKVRATAPDLPCFLIGHSMGGVIATNVLIEHPELVDGCVLSGPALATDEAIGPLQQRILKVIAALFPRLRIFAVDPKLVCSDPAVVADYINDPLVLSGKGSAKLIAEILSGSARALSRAKSIKTPMLLLHGEQDALAHPNGSRTLYNLISSADKKLVIYPKLYHEIFHESCKYEIYRDLAEWLNKHVK